MIVRHDPGVLPSGYYCRPFGPWYCVTAERQGSAVRRLRPVEDRLGREGIVSRFFDDPWALCVRLARHQGHTIACAESCTGGLVSGQLTAVPGASRVCLGGVVAYDNRIKENLLGVRSDCLERHGAVSEECAAQMAAGVRSLFGASLAISVTGIAGPGGAVPGKPVGTVCIGLSTEGGTVTQRFQFSGTRESIRRYSSETACAILVSALIGRHDAVFFGHSAESAGQ